MKIHALSGVVLFVFASSLYGMNCPSVSQKSTIAQWVVATLVKQASSQYKKVHALLDAQHDQCVALMYLSNDNRVGLKLYTWKIPPMSERITITSAMPDSPDAADIITAYLFENNQGIVQQWLSEQPDRPSVASLSPNS